MMEKNHGFWDKVDQDMKVELICVGTFHFGCLCFSHVFPGVSVQFSYSGFKTAVASCSVLSSVMYVSGYLAGV